LPSLLDLDGVDVHRHIDRAKRGSEAEQGCGQAKCTARGRQEGKQQGRAKAAAVMQAREDKVENLSARKSTPVAQQMQRRQSPIEAVQTQMLGEPVLELVLALERVSAGLCWQPARPLFAVRTVSRLWM
jgi:hypothetical protein